MKRFYKQILLFAMIVVLTATISCTGDKNTGPIMSSEEITARLYNHVIDEALDDFIHSYHEHDLKMLNYHHQQSNTIIFSFDSPLINQRAFLEMIRNDERVLRAENEPFIDWIFGELRVVLMK